METSNLYPFKSASLAIAPTPILPPVYTLTVVGETRSLNATINLIDTGETIDNYLVVAVVGKDGEAIGTTRYVRRTDVIEREGTKGVLVRGLDHTEKVNWPHLEKVNLKEFDGFNCICVQTIPDPLGSLQLTLDLCIDVHDNVTGMATIEEVTDFHPKVIGRYYVNGKYIPSGIIINPSIIELKGYPEIIWPSHGGVGPVVLPSFFAEVLLFENPKGEPHQTDSVKYKFKDGSRWVKKEQQARVFPCIVPVSSDQPV